MLDGWRSLVGVGVVAPAMALSSALALATASSACGADDDEVACEGKAEGDECEENGAPGTCVTDSDVLECDAPGTAELVRPGGSSSPDRRPGIVSDRT
jgi:hypothetical protein